MLVLRGSGRVKGRVFLWPDRRSTAGLLLALGFLTFFFAPLAQIIGLADSQATDNVLIIAMEPLLTVLIAWVFIREKITLFHGVAFGFALFGFMLLAGITPAGLARGWNPRLIGNLLILFSLVGEGAYSTLSRKLMERHPPLLIFGSSLVVGVFFLTLALSHARGGGIGTLGARSFSAKNIFCLAWLGPLGTTATYLYWMLALAEAPIASVALTLFVQPLFGSIWGLVFLKDRLNLIQAAGGALIFAAVSGLALKPLLNRLRTER